MRVIVTTVRYGAVPGEKICFSVSPHHWSPLPPREYSTVHSRKALHHRLALVGERWPYRLQLSNVTSLHQCLECRILASPLLWDWGQELQCGAPGLPGPGSDLTGDTWLWSSHQPPLEPPLAGAARGSRDEAGTQYRQPSPPLVLGGRQSRTHSGRFGDNSPRIIFRFVTLSVV